MSLHKDWRLKFDRINYKVACDNHSSSSVKIQLEWIMSVWNCVESISLGDKLSSIKNDKKQQRLLQ